MADRELKITVTVDSKAAAAEVNKIVQAIQGVTSVQQGAATAQASNTRATRGSAAASGAAATAATAQAGATSQATGATTRQTRATRGQTAAQTAQTGATNSGTAATNASTGATNNNNNATRRATALDRAKVQTERARTAAVTGNAAAAQRATRAMVAGKVATEGARQATEAAKQATIQSTAAVRNQAMAQESHARVLNTRAKTSTERQRKETEKIKGETIALTGATKRQTMEDESAARVRRTNGATANDRFLTGIKALGIAIKDTATAQRSASQTELNRSRSGEVLIRTIDNHRLAEAKLQGQVIRNQLAQLRLNDALDVGAKIMQKYQQSADEARRSAYSLTIAGSQLNQWASQNQQFLAGTVEKLGGFDFAMRRAAAALSISASDTTMFSSLQSEIEKLSQEVKLFSAEELAMGMYYWGSATGDVVDSVSDLRRVMAAVTPIMQTAGMTSVGLETALKGVVAVAQQFNLNIGKSSQIVKDMFFITGKTAVEFSDLIETFKMVGPMASSIGVSYQEMLKLAGAIGNAGIKGTMFGRAMRQLFSRLTKDPAETEKALDRLMMAMGPDFYGTAKNFQEMIFPEGQFVGIAKYLDIITAMYRNLDEAQRSELVGLMATAAERPTLIKLLDENAKAWDRYGRGMMEVNEITGNLADANAYFENSWKSISESIRAIIGEFQNKVAPLFFQIGESVMGFMGPILEFVGNLALSVHDFLEANPAILNFAVGVAIASTAMAMLGAAILTATGFMKLMFGAVLPNLLKGMVEWYISTLAVTSANTGLAISTAAASSSQDAFIGRINANRLAIEALIARLQIAKTSTLQFAAASALSARQGVANFGASITASVANIATGFTRGGAAGGFANILASVTGLLGKFKAIIPVASRFAGVAVRIGGKLAIVTTVITALIGFFAGLVGGVDNLGRAFGQFMGVVGNLWNAMSNLAQGLIDLLDTLFGFFEFLGKLVGKIGSVITGVFGDVAEHINNFVKTIADTWGWLYDMIVGPSTAIIDAVSNTVDDALGITQEEQRHAYEKSLREAGQFWNDMAINAGYGANQVKSEMDEVLSAFLGPEYDLSNLDPAMKDSLYNMFRGSEEAAEDAGEETAKAFINSFGRIIDSKASKDSIRIALGGLYPQTVIDDGLLSELNSLRAELVNPPVEDLILTTAEVAAEGGRDQQGIIKEAYRRVWEATKVEIAAVERKIAERGIRLEDPNNMSKAFATSLFGDKRSLYVAAANWSGAAVDGIRSKNPELRKQGALMLANFTEGFYSSVEEIGTASLAVVSMTNGILRSNNPTVRRIGADYMLQLAGGASEGGEGEFSKVLSQILQKSNRLMQSNNPQMNKRGYDLMLSAAKGLLAGGENLTEFETGILETAIKLMQSTDPAMRQSGYNMMQAVGEGVLLATPAVASAVQAAANVMAMRANAAITAIYQRVNVIRTALGLAALPVPLTDSSAFTGQAQQDYMNQFGGLGSNFNIPKLPGFKSKDKKDDSKSGSGSEDEQTPLERALEVAKNAAELVEALRAIQGYNVKQMVRSTMGGVAEAMALAMRITYREAKDFSKGKLQSVAEFSNAVGTVATAITAISDAMQKVESFKPVNKSKIQSVIDNAAESTKLMAKSGREFTTKKNVIAREFAETASAVATAIASAADSFSKIASGNYTSVSAEAISKIVDDMAMAIKLFVEAGKKLKRAAADAATDFAEVGSSVVGAVASAFDSFASIPASYSGVSESVIRAIVADIKSAITIFINAIKDINKAKAEIASEVAGFSEGIINSISEAVKVFGDLRSYTAPLPSVMDAVIQSIRDALERMVEVAESFDLSSEEWNKINAFADTVDTVMSAISATWEAHNKTVEFIDQFRVAVDIDQVFDQMELAISRMSDIASAYETSDIEKIKSTAEAASAISEAIEGFFAIGRNASNDPNTLERMVLDAVNAVMVTMDNFVASFTGYGEGIVGNFAAGIQSGLATLEGDQSVSATANLAITGSPNRMVIEHIVRDPDGALLNASPSEVASYLNGDRYVQNLTQASRTQ